jgi:DNA polymerase-3 subunit alpha
MSVPSRVTPSCERDTKPLDSIARWLNMAEAAPPKTHAAKPAPPPVGAGDRD